MRSRSNSACPRLTLSVGEALGAIGDPVVLDLLKEYRQDPVIEVGTQQLHSGTNTCRDHGITSSTAYTTYAKEGNNPGR